MPDAAVLSYRLGGGDGVSVEAAKWAWALEQLGFAVTSVAGDGTADRIVPGLEMHAPLAPREAAVADALADTDLVLVENVCSLPLNPRAAEVVARVLRGRPAVLHHHDLPWQRPQVSGHPPPPDDPMWRHVVINALSRAELAAHGVDATVVYNTFDPDPPGGRRDATRASLGVGTDALVVLQPTRALARKRVDASLSLAEQLGATYWLLGPAEDGFGPTLDRLLSDARCPVRSGPVTVGGEPATIHDAYAACDVVALPSSWEGFGNPAVESATHRKPLLVGPYPVAAELSAFGFQWFSDTADDRARLGAWLRRPAPALLEVNARVARRFFSLDDLPRRVARVLEPMGVLPRAR